MIKFTRADGSTNLHIEFDGDTRVTLTPREALDLWNALPGAIYGLPPELIVGQTEVTCPVCKVTTETGHSPVYEVDHAIRHNDAELDMRQDGPQLYVCQGDDEFGTVAYCCNACHALVTMPAEVDVNWS